MDLCTAGAGIKLEKTVYQSGLSEKHNSPENSRVTLMKGCLKEIWLKEEIRDVEAPQRLATTK